uniref:Uncharacterized protein n=1 Tax=viral metagenome TaxID=1070528 RepID=A0A6C0J3R4_9ZZZZ
MNRWNIIGLILGFIFVKLIFNNNENEQHKLSFNFKNIIKNGSLFIMNKHIHHWLISLVILFITIPYQIKYKNKHISILNVFFILFFLHGLTYKDRFIF